MLLQWNSQPLLFPLFMTCLILAFLNVLKTWKKSKANTTPHIPPGPRRLPIIGNMHHLVGSLPHCRLRDLAKKYGPIMHLQLGEVSHVVISSPDMAKEVMKTHDISFAQRPLTPAANILFYDCGDIVFASYGDVWRQLRKICIMELLSPKRVQSFRSIREEEVSNLINSISSNAGSPINLSKMLLSLTNKIASRTAFGKSSERRKAEFLPLIAEYVRVLGWVSVADFFPSFKLLHVISGTMTVVKTLKGKADIILESIIDEHRAEKKEARSSLEGEEPDDLVDVLLNLQDNGDLDFPITTDNIKAVLLDIFLAGTETSALVVEWAMSEMVKHPEIMEKAQREVRQIFNDEKVTEADIHRLKYLNLVIKETLRLHAPAPLLVPREARETVNVNGYEIQAKTRVLVNAWAIGRDNQYWHDAERFCPERFLDSSLDYKGKDFEYIPFGSGRRICPGMLYGVAMVEISLANLLYHFDWKLPNGIRPETLDMSEAFGATCRRKNDLFVIPVPCHPLPTE